MEKLQVTLRRLISSRPALLIGEKATISSYDFDQVLSIGRKYLTDNGQVAPQSELQNINVITDRLRSLSGADAVEWRMRRKLAELQPTNDCVQLARVDWSVVISASLCLAFEQAIADRMDRQPFSRDVTRISHPSQSIPKRSIPVFRLYGEPTHQEADYSMPLGAVDLALRRPIWRDLLQRYPDYAQGSPLFVAGVDPTASDYLDLFGTLFTAKGPMPSNVVFIDQEEAAISGPLLQLLSRKTRITFLGNKLTNFCNYVSELFRPAKRLEFVPPIEHEVRDLVSEFLDQISIPETSLPSTFNIDSHFNELCDALFRPVSTDWRPYIAELDFRRDCIDDVLELVQWSLFSATRDTTPVVTVSGEAGIGKTTVLKRVAFEVCKNGGSVFWIRRTFLSDGKERLHRFISQLERIDVSGSTQLGKIVFFCDDPFGMGFDKNELADRIQSSGLQASLVLGLRSSDAVVGGVQEWQASFLSQDYTIPYELTESELERFPAFLCNLKIVEEQDRAKDLLRTVPTGKANATDILCGLWFLIPPTRHQLEQSITGEYLRLGQAAGSAETFARFASSKAEIAKRAYEAVAVCSAIDLPLPITVLVRSLDVEGYDDWLAIAAPGQPLWGLIYDETNEEAGTITYRTRNPVVTEVITRHIRGESGTSGEYAVLKRLVNVCLDGGESYEEFLQEVLVRRPKHLQSRLSYAQGLDLYDLAISANSTCASVFLHHRGIWERRMGRDYKKAQESFEQALEWIRTSEGTGERRENVLVSIAATSVDEMVADEISPQAARRTIEDKLDEVRMLRGFHPYSSHVMVRLLNTLACHNTTPSEERSAALCQALEESERVVVLLSGDRNRRSDFQESIEMMLVQQARAIQQISDGTPALELAHRMGENGSLRALAAIGYKKLYEASQRDSGKEFNNAFEFISSLITQYSAHKDVTRLRKLRALLYARWRLYKVRGEINWTLFKDDVEAVVASERHTDDPIWLYYRALALAHVEGLLSSQSEWATLRRSAKDHPVRYAMRNYYLGTQGSPKRLQATITQSHGRFYAEILGENIDVPLPESGSRFRSGDSVTCYLGFSFMGPTLRIGKPNTDTIRPPVPSIYTETFLRDS